MRLRDSSRWENVMQRTPEIDQHVRRTGQGNGIIGQREGKEGNRAQKNPDGHRHTKQR